MRFLFDWIDGRTGLISATRGCCDAAVPGGAHLSRVLPATITFVFVVQILTGLSLWMYYSPSAQTAWESVYYVQHVVDGGWLLRGVHHYAAQVLVALIGLYILGLIFSGGYRPPREFVYWTALLMGMVALGACLTGDLLAWDQNSYASTMVRTKFLMLLPEVGGELFKLAAGGSTFGHLTLTRFFALHVGVFAPVFLMLLVLHGRFSSRADDLALATAERSGWYWPNQAVRNMFGCLAVLVIVGLLVGQHVFVSDHVDEDLGAYLGVALGAPADPDPANFYAAARPEWSFRGLYEFSNMFEGERKIVPIFIIPPCVVLVFLLMPIFGRLGVFHAFNVLVTLLLLAAIGYLSYTSYRHDFDSPDHQAALAQGAKQADRAKQLAASPTGIPATGALSLLRNDPKTQGPILYEQHCSGCHAYTGVDGLTYDPKEPTAPDLTGFASVQWLTGFLDPDQIKGSKFYGNTAFGDGDMVGFVNGTLKELRDEDEVGEEALSDLIACLAAEAQLDSPRKVEKDKVEGIDEDTMFLFEDFTCTDCHHFYTLGEPGSAPDLTGYGSRDWLTGIIRDPTDGRFYGGQNDRMPSYHKSPDDFTLTAGQVEMLVAWLRGEWYEPDKSSQAE